MNDCVRVFTRRQSWCDLTSFTVLFWSCGVLTLICNCFLRRYEPWIKTSTLWRTLHITRFDIRSACMAPGPLLYLWYKPSVLYQTLVWQTVLSLCMDLLDFFFVLLSVSLLMSSLFLNHGLVRKCCYLCYCFSSKLLHFIIAADERH